MQIWMTLILAVQLLSALVMIGLVLIQHGKGADMGASFGSGASGSLFGATGSANFLSRSTAACATLFFVCTLALTYMGSTGSMTRSSTGGSVLDSAAPAASAAPATGAIPSAAPTTAPAQPATPAASQAAVPAPIPTPIPAPAPAASK
jgi:preprotein translocase subunit SecG